MRSFIAAVNPYVASFDEMTVLKFPVMPREARIEGTATRTYDKA